MNLPLWTLGAVLVLIAFRRLGGLRLAIWQIVLGGALVVLLTGSIGRDAAWRAIDWEVIGFLFGVFVLGQALTESGLLARTSTRMLGGIRSADGLVLGVLFGSGIASAVLMNDTLAVIGTPLMLALARAHRLPHLARLVAWGLAAMGLVIGLKIALAAWGSGTQIPLWAVAAAACAPVLLASPRRINLTAGIDWHTLVFFAALFLLVRSVWDTGVVQTWLPADGGWATEPSLILAGSALLSQLVSNVPLVPWRFR